MADDEQPKRGRGRPRINPEGTVRRNVTVQVNSDLYDLLRGASEGSGLSISREIEGRLKSSFDNVAEVVKAAVAVEREKMDDEYVEFFGGRHVMLVAHAQSELFQTALEQTFREWNAKGNNDITDGFIASLRDRLVSGQDKVIDEWYTHVKMARFFAEHDIGEVFDKFRTILNSPEGAELKKALTDKFEGIVARRAARGSDHAKEG